MPAAEHFFLEIEEPTVDEAAEGAVGPLLRLEPLHRAAVDGLHLVERRVAEAAHGRLCQGCASVVWRQAALEGCACVVWRQAALEGCAFCMHCASPFPIGKVADGSLTVGAVALSELDIEWWRAQLGFVGQEIADALRTRPGRMVDMDAAHRLTGRIRRGLGVGHAAHPGRGAAHTGAAALVGEEPARGGDGLNRWRQQRRYDMNNAGMTGALVLIGAGLFANAFMGNTQTVQAVPAVAP